MKLSVYDEPGFRNVSGEGWRVLMDGRPLEKVFKVDTCAGVAWVADTDSEGNVRLDRKRDEIMVRRVFGPMRVEPMS